MLLSRLVLQGAKLLLVLLTGQAHLARKEKKLRECLPDYLPSRRTPDTPNVSGAHDVAPGGKTAQEIGSGF